MRLTRLTRSISGRLKHLSLPLNALAITALAFALSYFIKYDLGSISAFAPMEKATDFDLTDVYNTVADRRAGRTLSDDIVIVSIDSCSREGIMEVVDYLDYLNPAAIGLDVFFNYPAEGDADLIESLTQCDNIVFPVGLRWNGDETDIFGSYFYDEVPIGHRGVVNLAVNSHLSVVRDFQPEYIVGKDTLRSLSAELAKVADPMAYERLKARGGKAEVINYPSWEFEIIPAGDLTGGGTSFDEVRQIIDGKVVLIGSIFDPSDFHLTPIDERMPGLLIHARALQTILDSCYVDETSDFLSWLMAALLSFSFILLVLVIKEYIPFEGLVVRVAQFLLIYLFLVVGCNVFARHGGYLNFGPTLLMIGLGMLAKDIWLGLVDFVKDVLRRKNSKV